jgi:hypothetical protein
MELLNDLVPKTGMFSFSCRSHSTSRELPMPLHRREGKGTFRKAAALQGRPLPPHHQGLHVPGKLIDRPDTHIQRAEIPLWEMAWAESRFTAANSKMRTCATA